MNEADKISYVAFPRSVLSDLRAGKLTRSEYELYTFVRHGTDPFGKIVVSFEGLAADFAHRGWKKNTLTKLLGSLRKSRYLHYDERPGRRGSFEVYFPGIKTPSGIITVLPSLETVSIAGAASDQSEVRQSLHKPNQNFATIKASKDALAAKFSVNPIRSYHNEHDQDKERQRSLPSKKEIPVHGYRPRSDEDESCWRIATALGEETMGFILSVRSKYGIDLLEEAFVEYQRQSDKPDIRKRGAYFNGIVQKIVQAKERPP